MRLLTTHIGSLTLKNPGICGAGEQTMNSAPIKKALATGAGSGVVATDAGLSAMHLL